jgi:beta-galactosidase
VLLSSDADEIPVDGTGDARLVVERVDERGERVADDRAVTLTVIEGEGLFPSGRSITLSTETDSICDGTGAIEFRSYIPGPNAIRTTGAGLAPAEIIVTAVGAPKAAPARERRLPPPAPAVTEPPSGRGDVSLAAFRLVDAGSALQRHEGSNVTATGNGAFWRAASRGPGEWIRRAVPVPYARPSPRSPWTWRRSGSTEPRVCVTGGNHRR